jgi:hypothetical protein
MENMSSVVYNSDAFTVKEVESDNLDRWVSHTDRSQIMIRENTQKKGDKMNCEHWHIGKAI